MGCCESQVIKKAGKPAFDAFGSLFFLKTEFFLQIVDVSATMLEVLVIHDADLPGMNVGLIPST